MSDLSIVVPVLNGEKTIQKCLESILNQTYYNVDIVIVANGCTDGTVKICQSYTDSRVKVLVYDTPLGYAAPCNLGASHCRADKLLFFNADAWLEPSAVSELLAAFSQDPDAAAISMTLMDKDDNSVVAGCGSRGFDLSLSPLGSTTDVKRHAWAFTAFLCVRRNVFWDIGGFDEAMFMYGEEMDVSWRLAISGYSVGTCPSSVARFTAIDPLHVPSPKRRYLANRNRLLTIRKNAQHILRLGVPINIAISFMESLFLAITQGNMEFLSDGFIGATRDGLRFHVHRFNPPSRRSEWSIIREFLKPLSCGRLYELQFMLKRRSAQNALSLRDW